MNDISILVITYNEIKNLPTLVENIKGWSKELIVLDSGSTDGTVEFLKENGARVYYRKFDNYSNQRKYLLNQIEISTKWIFVLDADEYLTEELKDEISLELKAPKHDAYTINLRFYWMGCWVKRGYYPLTLIRFGRAGIIDCDDRPINEHLMSKSSNIGMLKNDFIDDNKNDLTAWFKKHIDYANKEADALLEVNHTKFNVFGSQFERRSWLREKIWRKLPLFVRPFLYFFYRLVIRFGFMDGKKAILYHFLHAFIYRLIIDAMYLEKKWNHKK